MFDGQQVKEGILATAVLLLLPGVVSAEVMDKEPTIEVLWAKAVVFGIAGLLAWRRGLRWGVGAALLSGLFVWSFYLELADPFVGPDILREAGSGYVSSAYQGFWVCALLHAVGAATFLKRRRAFGQRSRPVEAS